MVDAFLHWVGYGLCHQLPERSFFGGGHQLPVCARDTGIYFGFVIALIVIAALDRGRHRSELPPAWVLAIGVVFVGLMGIDGVTSYAGLRSTTNDIRLITGLMTGFALPLAVVPILNSQLWRHNSPERVLASFSDAAAWLAALPLAFVALRWAAPLTGTLYPLLTAVAIIVTFVAVNLIMTLLPTRFERRAVRLRDAWAPLALALALTVVEIAAAGWLRVALLSLASRG